jgi:hypothetical protein
MSAIAAPSTQHSLAFGDRDHHQSEASPRPLEPDQLTDRRSEMEILRQAQRSTRDDQTAPCGYPKEASAARTRESFANPMRKSSDRHRHKRDRP